MLGSGAFGLGFVGDIFIDTGELKTSIIVENRGGLSSSPDNKNWLLQRNREYNILHADGIEKTIRGFDLFECDFSNLSQEVINLFCDSNLKLITVSVPSDALENISNLLAQGLKIRAENSLEIPLVITCINELNNGLKLYEKVLTKISNIDRKHFPICIVDRVCSKPEIDNYKVTVKAESYASLTVQKVDNMNILDECNKKWIKKYSNGFLNKSSNIALHQQIKYVGVNGMHLFIAAISKSPIYSNFESNEQSHCYLNNIIQDLSVRSYIDGFINEISRVISEEYSSEITLEEIKLHLQNNLVRFESIEDTNERLLKELRLSTSSTSMQTIKRLLNSSNGIDELPSNKNINEIVDHIVGTFLRKVDLRLLRPILKLYEYDRTMPANLTTGASCLLHAMAKQVERIN
jgi:hypothetical protein